MLNVALVSKKLNEEKFGLSRNLNRIKLNIDIRHDIEKLSKITRSYSAVKLINFNDDRFEKKFKRFKKNFVSKISSTIKEIEMVDCDLQGYNIVKILKQFTNVDSLKMSNCDVDVINAVPKFQMENLRKIEVTMNNMIALFQDLLPKKDNVLEEIVLKGVYGDQDDSSDEEEYLRNVNIFSVLGPLIIRQKNLKALEIADFRFFRNEIIAPKFQLKKLFLPMPELYPVEQMYLLKFLGTQLSLESVNFNIMTTRPTGYFSQSFRKILETPTLRELSLVFYPNIGMKEVFMEGNVNPSVTNFAINITSREFEECLDAAVKRFPNANTVWLNKGEDQLTDENFLRPLNKLKNLKVLEVQHFHIRQVARVRCTKLKKLKFDPIDDSICELLQFVISHRDMQKMLLRLCIIDEDEFEELHEFIEFTLKWCKKLKSIHFCICPPTEFLDFVRIQKAVDVYAQKRFVINFCNKTIQKS